MEIDSNGNTCREGQWINGITNSSPCIDDELYDDEIAKLGKHLRQVPVLSLKIDEEMDNDNDDGEGDDNVNDEMLI